MADKDLYDFLQRRAGEMKTERTSFEAHWRELADFIRPRRGRFFISDRNKGDKRYNKIINSIATQAFQVARSGMLAGTMSPARPWFALEVASDPELMEYAPVKEFCYKLEKLIQRIYSESNLYDMSSIMLGETLQFGTGCMSHEDDFNDVARFYTHTVGAYAIAQNDRNIVDTLSREFEWTVEQVVSKFGLENCSQSVKDLYDKGSYGQWVPVCHYLYPNDEYDPESKLSKPFRSIYYEPGRKDDDRNKFLSDKGYYEFPAYVLRWELTDGDIYGTDCPGMTALGDIKQLQNQEKQKLMGIQKMVSPPMKAPPSMRNTPVNTLPNGFTIYDGEPSKEGLAPLYMVNPQLGELRIDIDALETRIKNAFHNNLFMAISDMEGIQPKNQFELAKRDQERLLQLGPVLQRFERDFLDPLLDRTINQCSRAGLIGGPRGIPIPDELQGQDLQVNYISSLAMAQRSVGTGGIERLAGFVGSLVQIGKMDALDKFDADQAIDEYSKVSGVPPSVVVPDELVAATRQQRAEQQKAAQDAAMAESVAGTAKTGAEALNTMGS